MSDLFSISISALQAFQQAISVVSNNIANANTPGYSVERANLTAAVPQSSTNTAIGSGVDVASVTRAVNDVSNGQLYASQSSLGQLTSLQNYTNQIANLVGTTAGGISTALQSYYSAWSTLANDPTSSAARQALLGDAKSVVAAFQSTNSQLQSLNNGVNGQITSDVSQINSLAASISSLNAQIATGTAAAGGQSPNALLDQRGADVSSLSQLVGIQTTTNTDGSINVFVGSGQPLVLQGSVTKLTTVPNPFNSTQLEISTATNGGNSISSSISGGDLGGLLAARSQAINPTVNQVGQLAIGLATSANAQQNVGLDLNGNLGTNLFSVAGPTVTASSNNASTVTATAQPVTSATLGSLTSDNYLLTYTNGAYALADTTTGQSVAASVTGNTVTGAGLSITLSGTPHSGDQFLVEPTAAAAGSLAVALGNPSQLAAASALQTSVGTANTGTGTISAATVVNPSSSTLLAATTISFPSPGNYSINGSAATTPLPASGIISLNGWQVQLSGTPAAGDTFTVAASSSGDNRNALASANQQSQGFLINGSVSITGGASDLITSAGSQAQQVNTAQTAQTAVNTQALATVASTSGVNLNEEAAALVQWQQAYQASAQAFAIGNSTFQTFISAIQSA